MVIVPVFAKRERSRSHDRSCSSGHISRTQAINDTYDQAVIAHEKARMHMEAGQEANEFARYHFEEANRHLEKAGRLFKFVDEETFKQPSIDGNNRVKHEYDAGTKHVIDGNNLVKHEDGLNPNAIEYRGSFEP